MIDIFKQGGTPEDYLTCSVKINAPFNTAEPARVSGATVSFPAGARTAWHTYPPGQTLIVTQGQGLVQPWGKAAQTIAEGDIIWIRPGVKHWHGASAGSAMTHIAIAKALEGKVVDWMENVSDEQYQQ